MEKKNSRNECSECGSQRFGKNGRETFCKKCGNIIQENQIEDQEYRVFNQKQAEKKARVGNNVTYTQPDKGFTTQMGNSGEMNNVSPGKRKKYYRMRKWHNRLTSNQGRRMKSLLRILKNKKSELKLPEPVFEETSRLTYKAQEKGLFEGRAKEEVISGLTYLVCKKHGFPRTLTEIADKTESSKHDIGNCYRYIARELEAEIKPSDPVDFLPRYASELGLSGKAESKARRIINKGMEDNFFAGKGPKGVVAAAIYYSCKTIEGHESLTQKKVARTVDVTQVTLRKTYGMIKDDMETEELVVA